VQKLFPNEKIARIDSDVAENETLLSKYQAFYDGDVNILIGTQSIAKGLDLPLLTLEVIIDADAGLHMPDYLAGERMFQLLYQVMGRIGRHEPGRLIVQTLTPDHPIIIDAIHRDYDSFYVRELAAREILKYPPYRHAARIVVEHTNEHESLHKALKIKDALVDTNARVFGPSPCFYPKLRNNYRHQLFILSARRTTLTNLSSKLPKEAYLDIDPVQLL
jgi:primosomal protein N' (replication factor Y)